jgi:lysophospholipase L1-like esterase
MKILIVSAAWTVGVVAGLSLLVYGALLPRSGAAGQPPSASASASAAASPSKPPRRLRMMLVGDSITEGRAGDFTWRYRLYKHLEAAGVPPDFVGPRDGLYDGNQLSRSHNYADAEFDTDHDAIWGRQLGDAKDKIAAEVRTAQPDYVLMLMGINDMLHGADPQTVEGYLRAFVANARKARPSVAIILGQVMPTTRFADDPAFWAGIKDYNGRVAAVANELSTDDSPIAVAATAADISPIDDLYDGVHPNRRGEVKIAKGFADVLAKRFRIGRPMARPTATAPAS